MTSTRTLGSALPVAALYLIPSAVACSNLDVGYPEEDTSPPRLERLLIQSNNRFRITDLLDDEPEIACSEINPCPVDEPGSPVCVIAPGQTEGICPRVLSVSNSPPAVDPVSNQVRIVWHKLLDTALADDLGFVRLTERGGPAVAATVRYEPSGSPTFSSIPFFFPYGPAIVFDTEAPLVVATTYSIEVDASRVRDAAGRTAVEDVNGPIKASYEFTTEHLYVEANNLGPVAPNVVLTFSTNAPIDEATLTSTGAVVVRTSTGADVPVRAFLHRGLRTDTATCGMGLLANQVDVVATSSTAEPADWPEGTLTIAFPGVRDASGRSALSSDAAGTPFEGEFQVAAPRLPDTDSTARESFVLPETCSP